MKRITVLLADDNTGVRGEFRNLVELQEDLEVVGEAKTAGKPSPWSKNFVPR